MNETIKSLKGVVSKIYVSTNRKVSDGAYGSVGFEAGIEFSPAPDANIDETTAALESYVKARVDAALPKAVAEAAPVVYNRPSTVVPVADIPFLPGDKMEPTRVPDGDGTADIRAVPGPLTLTHVVSEKGTHYVKTFGGMFTKYGISTWPEPLAAFNIKGWADWPVGEKHALPPETAMFVQFDGKKPVRVVKFE